APVGDRGAAAGHLPVLPDGGPAGAGLPAEGLRSRPVRRAAGTGTAAAGPAGVDAEAAGAMMRGQHRMRKGPHHGGPSCKPLTGLRILVAMGGLEPPTPAL